jgi:PilZ domain
MLRMTVDEPRVKVQREPRRQMRRQPAWIMVEDGMTKLECFVLDVSPGGARIVTDAAMDVRDTFGLALVPDHPKRQPCEVVWRRGRTYGVKFVSDAGHLAPPADAANSADAACSLP